MCGKPYSLNRGKQCLRYPSHSMGGLSKRSLPKKAKFFPAGPFALGTQTYFRFIHAMITGCWRNTSLWTRISKRKSGRTDKNGERGISLPRSPSILPRHFPLPAR